MKKNKKELTLNDNIDIRIRKVDYTCPYINKVQENLLECINLLSTIDTKDKKTIKILNKVKRTIGNKCIGLTSHQNKNKGNTGLEKVREFNSALREDKLTAESSLREITYIVQSFVEYKPETEIKNTL